MTKRAALLLLLGALLLVAGVGLWTVPGALVLAGLLFIAAGVLSLEVERRAKPRPGADR